jgi:TPR repeat protein|tara:strand:+ start:691 stop:1284 length:594 start_codon:yes stop_codon:yes gene_type:complete
MKEIITILSLLVALGVDAQQKKPIDPAVLKAKQDFERKKAEADKGDPVKLHELGDLYYSGRGTARNYAEAYKAYLAAAGKGYVISEATVGWMLRNGQGASKDYKKAMEWYAKAAEKGHVEAQMGLGEIYYNSLGLPKRDYATAYRWYAIAAGLGSKEAKAFTLRMQQTVLKDPRVTAEQKATVEKAVSDWLAAHAKK